MLARALAALSLVACGGCTIILDPDNLPAQTDAGIDGPPVDAPDPSDLELTRAEPTMLHEGTGAGGGRPALIVLHGRSLVPGATVEAHLEPRTPDVTDVTYVAAVDGTQAGVSLRIPVIEGFDGGDRVLRITVTQGDVSDSVEVAVRGLPELTLPAGGSLAPLYSRITAGGAVHFTGTEPVVLIATANAIVRAKLDVNASGQTAGPHGCDGGNRGAPGGCNPGGGASGVSGGGGGGGSFGSTGEGGGGAGGDPGAVSGDPSLVPLRTVGAAGNRGNGGGGSAGVAVAMEGKGGGGGGVLYLEAGGDIEVMDSGALEARGGVGTDGGLAGGGGGGSGGAIVVRAGGGLRAGAGWLSAPGGSGGASTTPNVGGRGGLGRVRIDAGAGVGIAAMATMATTFRGPAWAATTPVLVDEPAAGLELTLLGEGGRAFPLRLNDTDLGRGATPGTGNSATVAGLPLMRGRNQVCAVALAGRLTGEGAQSCVDVFYTGR